MQSGVKAVQLVYNRNSFAPGQYMGLFPSNRFCTDQRSVKLIMFRLGDVGQLCAICTNSTLTESLTLWYACLSKSEGIVINEIGILLVSPY